MLFTAFYSLLLILVYCAVLSCINEEKGVIMCCIKRAAVAVMAAVMAAGAGKPVLPDVLNPAKQQENKKVPTPFIRKGPTVQIGILLDTSGSMSGLIDQAKDQLWKIVNEVAKANKHDKSVVIQVGLFEYGKSSLPRYEGYLQMLTPLTSDLDRVSEELFRLRTNGGEEYAGKVILEAVNRFVWSDNDEDLKLLIIAGNESFAQGDVPYREAIRKARRNGIIVNTIYCGDRRSGINLHWKEGAELGGGRYFNIDHNRRRVYIATPYDDEIILLGKQLNDTYIIYGARELRRAKKANVLKQDANSMGFSKASYVERNIVKSKKQYAPAKYDMVTAYSENKEIINKISSDKLPDELKGKKREEIKAIVEKKKAQREKLQKQIRELEAKRAKYIADKSKKEGADLGSAIIKSIRQQAVENGFVFSR